MAIEEQILQAERVVSNAVEVDGLLAHHGRREVEKLFHQTVYFGC